MIHLVTGGAGFCAAHLIPKLLSQGHRVAAVDNMVRGTLGNMAPFQANPAFRFVEADCANEAQLTSVFASLGGVEEVWHLAANSDIPAGVSDPAVDLKDTFMTTYCTLQAMRASGAKVLHFASSSAIYGDFGEQAIQEQSAPYRPISNYGAMKLASEAQICAAAESFLDRADIYRFPNVVGSPATHGVILDFVRKLQVTPDVLEVLGDGTQQKAYMHVSDLIGAMVHIATVKPEKVSIFNIGPADDGVTVRFIAETVRNAASPNARIAYGDGNRGWLGDVPRFRYSTDKLRTLGWTPSMDSRAAVERAVAEIIAQ